MLSLDELKERLLQFYDPDDLLEALEITSEEILDRFEDKLDMNMSKFWEELESYEGVYEDEH